MSKVFSKGEIQIIYHIINGMVDYDSLQIALNVSSPQTLRNRLMNLGQKIQYTPKGLPTKLVWGISNVLSLALIWEREEYIGKAVCPHCLASGVSWSEQRVNSAGICFAHTLESRLIALYAVLDVEKGEAKK